MQAIMRRLYRALSRITVAGLAFAGLTLAMVSTIGCGVGPNYKRPTVEVPVTYRG